LIADDQRYCREGVRVLLDGAEGVDVTGEAGDDDQTIFEEERP
jgi:DNA-binding NarL/FixJ family response regulator